MYNFNRHIYSELLEILALEKLEKYQDLLALDYLNKYGGIILNYYINKYSPEKILADFTEVLYNLSKKDQ